MGSRAIAAGCLAAAMAFAAFASTLLPGVDLGDTGGYQAAVLWRGTSARQAYPLYYALARPFVASLAPADPARGLNLFSAVTAAAAAGVLAGLVTIVTRSAIGGAAAGLLLAFSYTFWTQAVIAEVYALHLALAGLCLLALAAWERRPGIARLAAFFAVYAVAFGNHLSMILLLAPFAVFLFMTARAARDLLRPAVVALALGIAAAGALLYLPNLLAVWTSVDAPARWSERLAAFWFDVTKADWRDTMLLGVGPDQAGERLAMFAFDARQQFGIAGLTLAAAGVVALWRIGRAWAVLVLLAYLANTAFALTYNVGDPHVFFLPGHYFTAFAAGAAVAWAVAAVEARGAAAAAAVAVLALGYAAWRGYDTWPAADRHADHRAERAVASLTMGLDEREALLVTELNWQLENALLYETRYRLPRVLWVRLPDVFLHFPMLVADNHAARRDIVLTAGAATQVAGAFGPLFPLVHDPVPPAPTLAAAAARIPRGALYVLALLPPPRGEVLDPADLDRAVARLAAPPPRIGGHAYEVVVGHAGERPVAHLASDRPFRRRLDVAEGTLDVRVDGWVSLETFRRGGFGHVILDRTRLMAIERGASLVWLGDAAPRPFYAAGLYAPQPRFRIPAAGVPGLALLH